MTKRPSLASSMKSLSETTTPDPVALVAKSQTPSSDKPSPKGGKRYAGMKTMLIPVPPEHHRKLRMIAIQRDGWTLERIVQEAIEQYLDRSKKFNG